MSQIQKIVFFLLICATMTSEIVQTIILPSLPMMVKDLHVSSNLIQMSYVSFFLATLFSNAFSPFFANIWGESQSFRLGLLIAFAGSLIGFVVLSVYPSLTFLLICRFLEGFGVQLAATFNQVFIGMFFSENGSSKNKAGTVSKTWVFSKLFKVLTLTGMLAPILGSFVMHLWSWQANFFISALCLLALLLAFHSQRNIYQEQEQNLRYSSFDLRSAQSILRHSEFLIQCMLSAFTTLVIVFYLVNSPFIFISQFGLDPKAYAWVNAIVILMTVLGAMSAGYLIHKIRVYWILIGCSLLTFGIASFGFVLNFVIPLNFVISLVLLCGILFASSFFSPICSAAALDCNVSNLTLRSSFMNFIQMLACVIGSFFAAYFPSTIENFLGFLSIASVLALWGGYSCKKSI